MRFYMSAECDQCGEEVFMGPCLTTLEHEDLPVIPFDFAAQEAFTCECGTTSYTGDFELITEDQL